MFDKGDNCVELFVSRLSLFSTVANFSYENVKFIKEDTGLLSSLPKYFKRSFGIRKRPLLLLSFRFFRF